MTSFIPFINIQTVFDTHSEKIEAIVYSLPCYPLLIKTPSLLEVMTGKKWEKTIISHNLFKIWIATLFYIRSLKSQGGPLSTRIELDLKNEQQTCFETKNGNDFLFEYLHCYEYAIIKYLHLFKVGEKGGESPDGGKTPPITPFILNIRKHAKDLSLDTLITKEDQLKGKTLDDFLENWYQKRKAYQITDD